MADTTYTKTIQDILDIVQDTAETLLTTSNAVATESEALVTHNTSEDSHPYLLQKIDDMNAVSETELSDAITAHNASTTAHSNLINSLGNTAATAVSTHNTSTTAHADIRNTVTNINTTVNEIAQYKPYIEQLDGLFGGDTSGTTAVIPAVTNLTNQMSGVNAAITNITNEQNDINDSVNDLKISQAVQDTKINALEKTVDTNSTHIYTLNGDLRALQSARSTLVMPAPNLLELSHTVPDYVKPGETYNVKFSNVTVPTDESLTFSLASVPTALSFSKTTDIAQDEPLTMSVANDATAGSLLSFSTRALLSPSADTSSITLFTEVASAPDMSTFSVSGIPSTVTAGTAYPYTYTPATDTSGSTVTYTVTTTNGTCTIDATTQSGVFTPASNATSGQVITITFRATTDNGYSESTVTTTVAGPISVTNLTCTVDPIVKPGDTLAFTISGATSSVGGIKYSISPKSGSVLVFTPNTNITNGGSVAMTVPSNAVRGTTQTFIITATDANNTVATKEFSVKINSLPVVTNLTCSIPSSVSGNTATAFTIGGATDPDNQAITYSISATPSNVISFSKTTGIVNNESLTYTPTYVTTSTTITITVKVFDSLNESNTKTFTVTAVPSLVVVTPTITYPADNAVLTSDAITFTFDPFETTNAS